MNTSLYFLLAALALPLSSRASDRIRPNDPAQKLEVIINRGLAETRPASPTLARAEYATVGAYSIFLRAGIWTSKSILNVCFWNGSKEQQVAVAESALRWNVKTRMQLSLYSSPGVPRICENISSGDIRVALSPIGLEDKYEYGQDPTGNWSLIGKQSTFPPDGKPVTARYAISMNLVKVSRALDERNFGDLDFYVGHEFGHALGLLHEFQASVCKGWINIKEFAEDRDLHGPMVVRNLDPFEDSLGTRFAVDYGSKGPYDVDSIMQYNFEDKYYRISDKETNPCRRTKDVTAPSSGDIATVTRLYGSALLRQFFGDPATSGDIFLIRARDDREQLQEALTAAFINDPIGAEKLKKAVKIFGQLERFKGGNSLP